MIGVVVPSAFAETYVFKNFQDVSVDIPSSFEIWVEKVNEIGWTLYAVHSSQGAFGVNQFIW